jgi:hypothetical protein
MSLQTWQETLINSQTDGPALTNSVTATSLLNVQEKLVLPANFFQIGRVLRIGVRGRISTVVTTPGTLTFTMRFGATLIASGPAFFLCTTAKTNVPWVLDWVLICRAIGSASNLMHEGTWQSEAAQSGAGTALVAGTQMIPSGAPAVGANFDSSVAQTLDFFAQWSVANAANSIQTHIYKVESLV